MQARSSWQLDKFIPNKVARYLSLPITQATYQDQKVILEGGALEVNGKGTLITTEECLLDPTIQVRNTGFTKTDYEAVFKEYFGVSNTIWLGKGIIGDDTHGHVDDLCRFVNDNTVVTVVEKNQKDKNYAPLQENLERLKNAVLENGSPLHIIELPMPKKIVFGGLQLPASYANFLILNNTVLVPTFNDEQDRHALDILANCFPDRKIIGIGCTDFIWGFGTLHCLSQQIPKESTVRVSN